MESEKPPSRLPKRPEDYDGLPQSPYWPTFVEKLLLAVIDGSASDPRYRAAKTPEHARQLRLADALKALFDEDRSAGASEASDLPRLIEIAHLRLQQEGVRSFAKEHLEFSAAELDALGPAATYGDFVDDVRATGEGGETATNRDRVRLSKKFKSEEFQDYAFHILTFREHEEERDMLNDLARVGEILSRWNIVLKVEPLALGMASSAYANTPD